MSKTVYPGENPGALIVRILSRIYKSGKTTTSGGNISFRDSRGDIWITPAAIDKGNLHEEDIVCVKKNGGIQGRHKPSSEYPFHKAIYELRPDIKAVIHAHPPALVSYSIARQVPDTRIFTLAHRVCGSAGYAAYRLPGSEELGSAIAGQFADKETMAVIMENHGTVIGGVDMQDAFRRFETLEAVAEILIRARTLGPVVSLSDSQMELYYRSYPASGSNMEYSGDSSGEKPVREELCSFIRRACRQGLIYGSTGAFSCRGGDDGFFISPADVLRWDIEPGDISHVKGGKVMPGPVPDPSYTLHARIYRDHPAISAIIEAQPVDLMAFAVTKARFDVRTIPESWIFLQDVPRIAFETKYKGEGDISGTIGRNTPAVLIENDSFLVTGGSILQAFDRLEVAELSARSLLMAAPLGSLVPMNDEQVEALRKKFLQ